MNSWPLIIPAVKLFCWRFVLHPSTTPWVGRPKGWLSAIGVLLFLNYFGAALPNCTCGSCVYICIYIYIFYIYIHTHICLDPNISIYFCIGSSIVCLYFIPVCPAYIYILHLHLHLCLYPNVQIILHRYYTLFYLHSHIYTV